MLTARKSMDADMKPELWEDSIASASVRKCHRRAENPRGSMATTTHDRCQAEKAAWTAEDPTLYPSTAESGHLPGTPLS